jgi:hypothetical protein
MEIRKISESSIFPSLLGLFLSYHIPENRLSLEELEKELPTDKYAEVAKKLANKGDGHNKFLQMMTTYWLVRMPRFWWSQFDTYRHAIQGIDTSVVSSESTMHTLLKRQLTQDDFHRPIDDSYLVFLNLLIKFGKIDECKNALPEGFLQTRVVCMNYEVIRNIIKQRKNHKLSNEWGFFIKSVVDGIDYEEIINNA